MSPVTLSYLVNTLRPYLEHASISCILANQRNLLPIPIGVLKTDALFWSPKKIASVLSRLSPRLTGSFISREAMAGRCGAERREKGPEGVAAAGDVGLQDLPNP